MRTTAIACVLLLSPIAAQADQAQAIAAECKLAESAYSATVKAAGAAPNAILIGCPGHEGLQDDTTRKQDRQRFSAAMSTPVPAEAAQYGKFGKIIFQRMISRGVPPEIATALTKGKAFKAAVAAAQTR